MLSTSVFLYAVVQPYFWLSDETDIQWFGDWQQRNPFPSVRQDPPEAQVEGDGETSTQTPIFWPPERLRCPLYLLRSTGWQLSHEVECRSVAKGPRLSHITSRTPCATTRSPCTPLQIRASKFFRLPASEGSCISSQHLRRPSASASDSARHAKNHHPNRLGESGG